ncbi:hypothetical protein [Spiroplasma endosymbiont of Villa modesta]|uniref:hypothetical protein n=1 Tax=Spiroplasma endosymbiont of Villa modesta TaxID=3066293 RepID=UPI00313AA306
MKNKKSIRKSDIKKIKKIQEYQQRPEVKAKMKEYAQKARSEGKKAKIWAKIRGKSKKENI